jgi:hypothetical protein
MRSNRKLQERFRNPAKSLQVGGTVGEETWSCWPREEKLDKTVCSADEGN